MIGLLRLIRDHPDALEADLSHRHGMDLRDYWRRDSYGRRLLTLRQIAARVRWLPADSAVARVLGGPGWTNADYLLADVFHAHAGKPHPGRPAATARTEDPARARARASALARARAHRQAVTEGGIT